MVVDTKNNAPVVFAVPRPNSGQYSTRKAEQLLPRFIQRSIAVKKTNSIVKDWQSPTQGIRVHVTAGGEVDITDFFGQKLTGIDSINQALESTMTDGNARSVLLTSEKAGWDSPTKTAIIKSHFQSSVQIYLVGHRDELVPD